MVEQIDVGHNCPITGLKVVSIADRVPRAISHFVGFKGSNYLVQSSASFVEYLNQNPQARRTVVGCLLNYPINQNLWLTQRETTGMIIWTNWLSGLEYPKSDLEKVDFALKRLFKMGGTMGSTIELDMQEKWNLAFFCIDINELKFILRALSGKGLISLEEFRPNSGQVVPWKISITFDGIFWLNQEEKEVQKDLCFVAMSFGPDENPIFTQALKPAIEATGYQARRVDDTDHHIDKEQTINDAILALAKKASFVVCDYTGNKRGVYFEHGYAWGMGKKVIMTVKESEMADLHFDVSHYPFIVWKDYEDLKIRLQAKIESWIGKVKG